MFKMVAGTARKHAAETGPLGTLCRAFDVAPEPAKKEGDKVEPERKATPESPSPGANSSEAAALPKSHVGWSVGEHVKLNVVKNAEELNGHTAKITALVPASAPHTAKLQVLTGPRAGQMKGYKFQMLVKMPQPQTAATPVEQPGSASGAKGDQEDMSSDVFGDISQQVAKATGGE